MKYDVFLSYKSEDYRIAMKVNRFLTESGLKVFFSEVSLGDIGESEYSDSIDKAIDNSKNMVVVSSKIEYLTQGWVRYEWSAFADNIKSGLSNGNLITILAPEVKIMDLPLGLRHRQSFTTKNFTEGILPYLTTEVQPNKVHKTKVQIKPVTYIFASIAIIVIGIAAYGLRHYNKEVYPVINPTYLLNFKDSSVVSMLSEKASYDIDTTKVATYFDLALNGSSEGQYEIGSYCYDMECFDDALYWFTLSAKQGNPKSANGIGRCYYNGNGTMRWPRNAYNWFHRSADGNFSEGMNHLGKCLVEGSGVIVPNKKKALKYYKKAAELSHVSAQYNLGVHYFFGNGTKVNVNEGLLWILTAAHSGSASAQYTLGNIYSEGMGGIKIDMDTAISWYNKAIENTDERIRAKSMDKLRLLRTKNTQQQ